MLVYNINPNKLHDELIKGEITPILVQNDKKESDYIAENTWLTFADGTDMALVQQIIDAHDPTPLPPQPTTEEIMNDYIVDMDFRLLMIELGF